ncbi:MAG: hypothetical protein WC654_00895, partial [Patescibacteria group bacterium]
MARSHMGTTSTEFQVSEVQFKLDGWGYWEDRIEDLAARVRAKVSWIPIVTDRGGKAFGLSFAQALADGVFWVPPWISVLPGETHQEKWLRTHPYVIVRSNAMNEDWEDSRAGLHESKGVYSFDHAQKFITELLAGCGGVVLQHRVDHGVGVVVDLGWSELLHRNVLRVAIGCPSQQGGGVVYTSPTWDHEAGIGVFDASTGEAIVDLKAHYFDVKRIVDKMVTMIVPRLMNWGITFGLQFEFVGNLHEDNDALVQVRPSPGDLRGQFVNAPTEGQLLVTTGKVNRPGEARGETIFVDGPNDRRRPRQLYTMLSHVGQRDIDGYEFSDDGLSPEFTGRIVVWNYDALQRYGASLSQVLGAWKVGAIAQVASRAVFINSAHGTS